MNMSKHQLFFLAVDLADTCEMLNDEISEHKKRFKDLDKRHTLAICEISALQTKTIPSMAYEHYKSQAEAYKDQLELERHRGNASLLAEIAALRSRLEKINSVFCEIIEGLNPPTHRDQPPVIFEGEA